MLQKSRARYHKYKGRCTDVVKAYKELEAENGKIKNVMQQTQVRKGLCTYYVRKKSRFLTPSPLLFAFCSHWGYPPGKLRSQALNPSPYFAKKAILKRSE